MTISMQLTWLFTLALPVACIAWTVTHEEVFREPREFCVERSKKSKSLFQRKWYYLFTCEYCFSHYIALFFLWLADFQLLLEGWRGYLIGWFALVWVANVYMSLFAFVRVGLKKERAEANIEEKKLEQL